MKELAALRVRGWATSDQPAALIEAVLGPSTDRRDVSPPTNGWWVADPLTAPEPIGPLRSLVVVETDGAEEIDIVPGSMGLPEPPDRLDHAVVRAGTSAGQVLIFDARCWWRPRGARPLRCSVSARMPSGVIRG